MSALPESRRDTPRPRTILLAALGVLLAAGVIWGPRIWEAREYRQIRAMDAQSRTWRVLPGHIVERRSRIDPGISERQLEQTLGAPSRLSRSGKGAEAPALWTYLYSDGSLDVSVRDGYVQQIATTVGPRREIAHMPGMQSDEPSRSPTPARP
jgi:hypothetical protein